jgi:sarcosine oxidase, subunit gamma
MAELRTAVVLRRSASSITAFSRPRLSLQPECLGIAKLHMAGRDLETRFRTLTGIAPPSPRTQYEARDLTFAWLAPGEWLATGPEPLVGAWVTRASSVGDGALLAVEITHARASFVLAGEDARAALAAHCPLDLWPATFPVGMVARSLLGDTRMFIARLADAGNGPSYRIIVDQTMSSYATGLLARADTVQRMPCERISSSIPYAPRLKELG